MTAEQRAAIQNYRDARAAMALIREAVEDCAPPGSVARADYLMPEFTAHAEALVRGIYAIAGNQLRRSKRKGKRADRDVAIDVEPKPSKTPRRARRQSVEH